ncbi:GNAT family N-acetyltransferase [Pseudomonas sp. NC26]|uniref:GNAT family N-acetyltransferase n=1 Tax=Pseudomonas putida TaxID=303 RepID=A0A7W2L455_PSEPU|nr:MULTISPECIES: GNAT family N-acetyltransferase [Pseudomonas]MBA6118115.1 GNAT family N-acetyltransferase [Pseudomonas putida]MCZ9639738.1 GNAT family N-acetyltransferase [Pseudomonas putida]MEC4878562.1 GNAT family N-acetyltransferase [Pseudomonas sp. NC26]QNL88267.1 Uncharacterized protein PPKH_2853 [Pseudomonas putida]
MVIRTTRPGDIAHLAGVERSAAQAFARVADLAWLADGDVLDSAAHRGFMLAECSWVAEDAQGQVLGFLCASMEVHALHVHELSVRLEAQGQGVGRRLLDHAAYVARRRGFEQLTLTTFAEVPWNAPFYARYGFERIEEEHLSPRLRSILASEAAHGLAGRCAMRLRVE